MSQKINKMCKTYSDIEIAEKYINKFCNVFLRIKVYSGIQMLVSGQRECMRKPLKC